MTQISLHTVATAAARATMLRASKAWQSSGQVNRALGLYAHLVAHYPDSEEASEAVGLMLTLAQEFERQGRYQLAMSIHERLQALT